MNLKYGPRFLNRDAIEEAGGINLYGFVNNSPANFLDVLGYDAASDAAAAAINANWEQTGQGGMGGDSRGPSTITGVWGIQGSEGTDWSTKQDVDMVKYNLFRILSPVGFGDDGPRQSSGDGLRDIGQAIGGFFKGVFSGGTDATSSLGNMSSSAEVILGTPVVKGFWDAPYQPSEAQSANGNQSNAASLPPPYLAARGPSYGQGLASRLGEVNDLAGNGVGVGGLLASNATLGSNLKLYTSGWRGNQFVSTVGLEDVAKVFGNLSVAAGAVIDGYKVLNGQESIGQGAANTAVGVGTVLLPPPFDVALGVGYLAQQHPAETRQVVRNFVNSNAPGLFIMPFGF